MATTEERLGRFYIELQAWIDGGCPDYEPFVVTQPICDNLLDWIRQRDGTDEVHGLIYEQFVEAGLRPYNPFDPNHDAFMDAMEKGTLYANPARLAWIKEHAEAAKATGQAVPA